MNSRAHQEDALLALRLRRLATQHTELRAHLEPVLAEHQVNLDEEKTAFENAKLAFPTLTEELWVGSTIPEKYATVRRVAHKPVLLSDGLTIQKVRDREAFMVYKIDAGANNSKFYEAIILPSDDGSFRVKRRWGALTDSGQTGRMDGQKFDFDPRFSGLSLSQAKGVLLKVYKDRLDHGYTDAFGPDHVTPDGKKLPSGQYPVGLARQVGFGWGTQSVSFCVPALRQVKDHIQAAQNALRSGDHGGASEHQNLAERLAQKVLQADSSMGQKILENIEHMQGRAALVLSGRAGDSEVGNWTVAMSRLMSYLDKQLSLCNR
jgi:hypothetical protein